MGFSWIFLLFFIAVGIVGGVVLFFGSDIDTRGVESAQLASHLRACIVDGRLNVSGESISLEQLATACKIDAVVILDAYVLAVFRNDVQIVNAKDTVSCDFKGATKNQYYPRCREEQFTLGGDRYVLRVGSHQITRRAVA